MYLYVCIKTTLTKSMRREGGKQSKDRERGREIRYEGGKEVEKPEESKEEEKGGRITRKGNREKKMKPSLSAK